MAIKIDFSNYDNLVEALDQANIDYQTQLNIVCNVRNALAAINEPSAKTASQKVAELADEISATMDTLGQISADLYSSVNYYKKIQDDLNKKVESLKN